MKIPLPAAPRGLLVSAFLSLALAVPVLRAAEGPPVVAKPAANAPVTVTDNGATWTMDNGIIQATINKGGARGAGNMPRLVYHGMNIMGPGGIWEQSPSGAAASVTIDPAKNGGERGEV